MRITKKRLKQIIKEEMEMAVKEANNPLIPDKVEKSLYDAPKGQKSTQAKNTGPEDNEKAVRTLSKLAEWFIALGKAIKQNKVEDLDMKEIIELYNVAKNAVDVAQKGSAGTLLSRMAKVIDKQGETQSE